MIDNSAYQQLPSGWAKARVEEVYQIVSGGTPSTQVEAYWQGDIPWITSADIQGPKDIRPRRGITREAIQHSATNLVPAQSIIVVTRVALGKVALTAVPICFSQDSQALVSHNEVLAPEYALWFLSQAARAFKYSGRGTTISGVTKKQLADLMLAIPPRNEQIRIVTQIEQLLSDLYAGVAALQKAKAQLKRYRQAVLNAAVTGELTAEWRAANAGKVEPASVLLERVRTELAETANNNAKPLPRWNTEKLGKLPEGWCWASVREISKRIQYGTSEKADEDSSGVPVLRMGNIQDGRLEFDGLKYLPISSPHLQDFILDNGDVLFNRTNSAELVGKTAVYKRHHPKAAFASYLIRVRVREDAYDPDMLTYVLNSVYGRHYIASVVSQQVGQANVNGTKLSQMPIPFLLLEEQQEIVAEVERRLSVADEVERTVDAGLAQAERLRQSILKRAFAGRLVPQDPNDEPAEKLLERIKAARAPGTSIPRQPSKRHSAGARRGGK